MEQPPLPEELSRKEQEFIDHSLLAPTYIRDSNNYIIDFMESPALVFPNKTVVHVPPNNGTAENANATVPTSDGSYAVKVSDAVTLTPDLHFPSSIFHYRPTQSDVSVSNVSNATEAALRALNTPNQPTAPLPLVISNGNDRNSNGAASYDPSKHTHTTQYITLNGDFLATSDNKGYCDATEAVNQTGADAAVQQFLLADPNVTLDEAADIMNTGGDVLYARHVSNARKVLPHKKRLSRKLRVSLNGADSVLPEPLGGHKLQQEERLAVSVFSCEICGNTSDSQLQFFAHLKQHYEPTDTILAAMKTSLEELQPEKMCQTKKPAGNNVDQVFNDVHLNFADFPDVDETPMRHVIDAGDGGNNEIKILNTNDMSKCMDYVSQSASPPLKGITPVEVEFSDSEDMLEGIRNVVDKVSIEDTCDAIDLMSSNGMRATWFANDNFSGITFKNKPFNDVSFSEPLPPMPMMTNNAIAQTSSSRETPPLPPAEKLLAYQKPEVDGDKMSLQLELNEDETNRASYYSEALPPLHLTSVDEQQHQRAPTQQSTAPRDLLQPMRVIQFELRENTVSSATAINESIKNDADEKEVDDEYMPEEKEDALDDNDEDDDDGGSWTTGNRSKKIHFCPKCSRKFNSRNALKYHDRTHTGQRPHACSICGKTFYALSALKTHTLTHTGDKPYKCESCERRFRQWGDLKYHIESIHMNEKNYQCEFCGKAFARKYSLVLHRRIHTSECNFRCEYCGKTFRASTYLQNHRKIHTGEKPHECAICLKRFRMRGDLRRHETIHQRKNAKISKKK